MRKNPGIAALLSFIIPGSGLIYCESIVRGIVFFIIWAWLSWNMVTNMRDPSFAVFLVLTLAIWIYGIITSKRTADRWNERMKQEQTTSL